VLLTGEVPNEESKKQVEDAVRTIENVKEVTNELRSREPPPTPRVAATPWSLQREGAHGEQRQVLATHIKSHRGGRVYLMGLVTPAEGDAAVEVAHTSGVNRVVKVFEYIGK